MEPSFLSQPVKIAIVGRPNVGKSSLFNRLCGARISICHEEEGVTRDRIYGKTDFFGRELFLIDTGGISKNGVPFAQEVKEQALLATEEADVIVLVVDSRSGVVHSDEEVVRLLRRSEKRMVLAVNKIDDPSHEHRIDEFYSLGIADIVGVSALQNRGIEELLECALTGLPTKPLEPKKAPQEISIAILGRSNVGKSTLLNSFLQQNRSLVSDAYATTRDPIRAAISVENTMFSFVDTAGIRRKKAQKSPVEKFADIRTQKVLEQADLCLFLIDSTRGMTTEEKKIASLIEASGKGCILLCNKWDLVTGFRQEHCLRALREEVPFFSHVPVHFLSAKMQTDFSAIFRSIFLVEKNAQVRITTGALNRFLTKALEKTPPPRVQGKQLKIYYLTQASTKPTRFIFFLNRLDLLKRTYAKYLVNQLRKEYPLAGIPLEFKYKTRKAAPSKESS